MPHYLLWVNNNMKIDQEIMDKIRKIIPQSIAESIVNIDPMPDNIIKELIENSSNTSKLIEDGYKPVSNLGLLWIKTDQNEEKKESKNV